MTTRSIAGGAKAVGLARTEQRVLAVLARRGRRAFMKDLLAAIDELGEPQLTALLTDLHDRGLVSGPSGRLREYGLTVEGWHALREAQAFATRTLDADVATPAGATHRR